MTRIRILPEILSNKIAAGEVVERPASVVKELVENALDAGSTRIIIDVENGGRSLIRVSDNGAGMGRDDALLSLERYATSKIHEDRDLFSILTLGFRGEALPSIASVSRFSLVTRDETSDGGIEISVEGGTIRNVVEVGAPRGTMVTVKQLFFNTPARRKFLKTTSTEMGHIADIFARIALGHPKVKFQLQHNGRVVKSWPIVTDPADRVVDVLGREIKKDLFEISSDGESISVSGWISSHRTVRRTSRGIFVYVNERFVRDRVIHHALMEGYAGRLVKGQYPVAVIRITVPHDQVDVNVHPTKQEIRFAQQKKVHEAVSEAVSRALRQTDRTPWTPKEMLEERPAETMPRVSEAVTDFEGSEKKMSPPSSERREQATLWKTRRFSDLRIIGQFHGTYILCESDEELVLIDQHAAHERILFEQLKSRSPAEKAAAQIRLVPETIEFGYRESGILKGLIPDLHDLGLDIEFFGGSTFVIKSVPAILEKREIAPLIREIVEKMAEIGYAPGLEAAIDHCLMLMACHAAVRANQRLTDKEIQHLLTQLDHCEHPSNCPHGRPTWIEWNKRFIEKSFKRVV